MKNLTVKQNEDGKYGFVDDEGNWVIDPKFDGVGSFRDEIAKVKIDGKYGFIRPDGSYLYEPEFLDAFRWSELGIVHFKRKDEYGFYEGWTYFKCENPPEDVLKNGWYDGITKSEDCPDFLVVWNDCGDWWHLYPDGKLFDKSYFFDLDDEDWNGDDENNNTDEENWEDENDGEDEYLYDEDNDEKGQDISKYTTGICLTNEQVTDKPDIKMAYLLSGNGVVFVVGNDWLHGVDNPYNDRGTECAESQRIVSQLKDLEFHTAIVFPGVKGLGDGCFNSCHGLKRLIVHDRGLLIHTHCAEDTPLQQLLQKILPMIDTLDRPDIASELESIWSNLDIDE